MPKDDYPLPDADPDPDPDPSDADEGEQVSPNHPVPPPFNPIRPLVSAAAVLSSSAAEAAVLAAKGASVVPDLMRVYESLTQSSTPHNDRDLSLEYHHDAGITDMQGVHAQDLDAQAQAQYSNINGNLNGNHPHSVYHPYDIRGSDQQAQQQAQQQQQPIDPQFGANTYAQAWTHDGTSVPGDGDGDGAGGVAQYSETPFLPSTMAAPVHSAAPVVSGTTSAAASAVETTASPNNTSVGARSLRKRTAATSFANSNSSISNGNNNTNNTNNNSNNNRDDSSSASFGDNTSTTRGSKVRRKGKDSDGRWSKRFTWPEDLHRDFVSAVFDVGLKHSSPSTILEHMPKHEQITSERIKSHLQKYRLHRAKSKKEFMASYESAVTKIQKEGLASITSLGGAQVPAHLTYVTMTETSGSDVTKQGQPQQGQQQLQQETPQLQPPLASPSPQGARAPATAATTDEPKTAATQQQQEALMLPRLSEAEKQSPIGASMGYLMGLFFSLKQQLVSQRAMAAAAAAAEAAKKNQPVAAVFDAFVSGNLPATGDIVTVNPDGTTTVDKVSAPNAVPSARSNLEENNIMKREMKNQMAFQNKMRALKMQELKKLKTVGGDEVNDTTKEEDGSVLHLANAVSTAAAITANSKAVAFGSTSEQHGDPDQLQLQPVQQLSSQQQLNDFNDQQQQDFQGAGEAAADGGGVMFEGERNRSMSIGASEDFWNTDVVDDQLFEFLMNN